MKKGTYIVTGATGGIGRAIVTGLLAEGVEKIILACRNITAAEKIIRGTNMQSRLSAQKLDLSEITSVKEFTRNILAAGEKIAGIFNNAGTMPGKVIISADGYEIATQVNFIATAMMTELLIPTIIQGGGIVFTTSMTRRIARLHTDWNDLSKNSHERFVTYGRSKLMLTHYALDLAKKFEGKIRVNCSDPWIVNSQIIKMGHRTVDALSEFFGPSLFRTPEEGAAPALNAMRSNISGEIFTLRSHKPIPASFHNMRLHSLPREIIKAELEKLENA